MIPLLLLVPPSLAADEHPSYHYTAGPGVILGQNGIFVAVCGGGCDVDGDGSTDVEAIGSVDIPASTTYSNVFITLSDDVWGANVAAAGCFLDEDGLCITPEGGISWHCGSAFIVGSPFPGDTVRVYVATLRVDPDLNLCGGTTGQADATYF